MIKKLVDWLSNRYHFKYQFIGDTTDVSMTCHCGNKIWRRLTYLGNNQWRREELPQEIIDKYQHLSDNVTDTGI